jgi:penicillin-binding protein 1A
VFTRRRKGAPRSARGRRIRKLRLVTLAGVLALLGAASFTFGLVAAVASEVPSLDPARQQARELNGYVYANDGKTILAVLRGDENRVLVSSNRISPWMKHAIVAIEDRRFYDHRGVDMRGIVRALWQDIRQKEAIQGGSTITQQYVKNAYAGNERTIGRKVREAALAWQLENQWKDKDRILTAYLNTIYFGNGAYGIQQAARIYFGHGAKDLTIAESALLAGIPQDPSHYDPVANPENSRARRDLVLQAMHDQGFITLPDLQAAQGEPLPKPEDVRQPGTQTPHAPYFTNYVTKQLIDRFGAARVYGGGLRVTTTIDLGLQELARKAIAGSLEDPEGPDAALVALDPTTGNVLAMVGGRNFRQSQFNLAVQGQRQPGSAFKPFVLATALEKGISPASTMTSRQLSIPLGDRPWAVHNYEDAYLGPISLETATVHSDNAVYAQLAALVGIDDVIRVARRLGVTSPMRQYFSLALGAQASNPLELARAYAAFANGGYRFDIQPLKGKKPWNRPRAVDQVLDADGDVVDAFRPSPKRVMSPRTAAYVNHLLQGVVEQGTGKRAALPGWPAAGKTGTTENYGDAWFVGYTPQLVVAVWVGYPRELKPMLTEYHGEPVSGGSFPTEIWKAFVQEALPYLGKEPEAFEPPPGDFAVPVTVVQRDGTMQLDNGNCHNAYGLLYFTGTGPQRTANCKPNEVEVPNLVGRKVDAARLRLETQPLRPIVLYRPAEPGEPVDVVVSQDPPRGRLSAYDQVRLWLPKPLHGVVPKVQGLKLGTARRRLGKLKLDVRVASWTEGPAFEVVAQQPKPGVAAEPGMRVRLVVARG